MKEKQALYLYVLSDYILYDFAYKNTALIVKTEIELVIDRAYP